MNPYKAKYLTVLQKWNHQIHAPVAGGARRKVYPQQLFHDLLDALMLRDMDDEIACRDLGLFSKMLNKRMSALTHRIATEKC